MYRLKPIRTSWRVLPPRALRHGASAAFWIMLLLTITLGGERALGGIPLLASAILPPGVIAAQASDVSAPSGVTVSVLLDRMPASPFAPQVLDPVVAHAYPAWLVDGARENAQLHDRRVPFDTDLPPRVAIVIDDLGQDLARTDRALALPSAITLSFMPYADATPWIAPEAKRLGHEVLVHVPMQATGSENPGPLALRTDLPAVEIRNRLVAALARAPVAIGINNHMGSAFTADRNALMPVVEELSNRHLLFFDSRTTPDTQVVRVARAFGVASADRDVFLDDEQTADAVGMQLTELESRARLQGVAIAIGHPHDVTLTAVAAWADRIAGRGFTLVPLSVAIRLKTERDARLSLAAAGR